MAANEWSEKTRMMITIGVAVVVNLGLGWLCYSARSSHNKLQVQYKGLLTQIDGLKAIVSKKDEKQLKFNDLSERFKLLEKLLPETTEEANLVRDIANIANTAGVDNEYIKAQVSTGGRSTGAPVLGITSYAREVYKTKWKADFMGWQKLMNEMEEGFPRFVGFENLVITAKNNGVVTMGTQHEVVVDLVTYKYVRPLGQ